MSGPSAAPLRRNRDFVLLQAGQLLSSIGSESTGIAYPLLVLALTHSPAKAGVVGFARILPWALFGFGAGVAVDRVHRKRLMIVADVLRAATLGSLVAAIALGRLTFAQVAVVAFVEGTLYVFFNVAEIGALRSVVPKEQLTTAAAAEQGRYATVVIAAPPLGGALFGIARALPFVADVVSYVFSVVSLLAIRKPFQEERERDEAPLRTQVAEGFRFLWRHPFVRDCAFFFAVGNLAFEGLFLTFIVLARRHGLSGGQIGALIAAVGVVALGGSLATPLLQRVASMRTIVLGSFWLELVLGAFLLRPSIYVLLAAYLPIAFVNAPVSSVVIGYRVAVTPDRLTGRVNGVARTIAVAGATLGPLTAGLLLGSLSPRATVGVFVGLLAVLAVVATATPSMRHAPSLDELAEPPLEPAHGAASSAATMER